MLTDYTITSLSDDRYNNCLKGQKVKILDSHNKEGVVIEHIFEKVCIVRWQLLRNKTGHSVEFIKDLVIGFN